MGPKVCQHIRHQDAIVHRRLRDGQGDHLGGIVGEDVRQAGCSLHELRQLGQQIQLGSGVQVLRVRG